MATDAGGTRQRLKPGSATMLSLENQPGIVWHYTQHRTAAEITTKAAIRVVLRQLPRSRLVLKTDVKSRKFLLAFIRQ